MSKKTDRLYEQFRPEHYELHVTLNKDRMRFSSDVVITGQKIGRPSKRITLHAQDLNITSAKIIYSDKNGPKEIPIERINQQKSFHQLRLHAKQLLYPGNYTLQISTKAKITKPMQGLYPCYFKHQDQEKFLLATQFEADHAREVFPCVDEPEAKATFDLTLTGPKDEVFLSNTPEKLSKTAKHQKTVTFEQTPKMSPYLLAFVVGELHSVSKKTSSGTQVASWSSVGQDKKLLQYSVSEAVKLLDFYEDYFGVAYPLAKCDQVALPDFDAGAMENWGLITYREVAMLADPDNRSISSEQYISMVIAHELSHQWFGNLVTMRWWDDLWLNESFASIMEHLALDVIHPDWQQWEAYASSDILTCSSRDVFKDVQPVSVEIKDPDLIETLFDPGIVYTKGGRLLKMLKDYIGDEAFRAGLKSYFKKYAYQNTSREDLWQELSAASKQNIHKLMTPWLEKPGMPVITIDQKENNLAASQKRFLLDGDDKSSLWPVPLLTSTSKETLLLEQKADSFKLPSDEFTVVNTSGSGHYFTRYQQTAHQSWIAKQIASQEINTEARINTLNDMYMLSRGGVISLTEGLDIVINCHKEPRDGVWSLMSRIVGAAAQLTDGDKQAEASIKTLKRTLGAHWYKKLGWQDTKSDDPNTKQLRHTALALMVGGEDKSAVAKALEIYKASSKNLDKIHAEHRNTILAAAVKSDDRQVIDNLLSVYPDATQELQQDISLSLAATKNPKTAQYVLDKSIGESGFVRAQDLMRWLAYFMRNYYAREIAWQYIQKDWKWIHEMLERSKSFDYLPLVTAAGMSTETWLKEYEKFFKDKASIKVLQQNIKVGTSDIKAKIKWRQRDEKAIKTWLSKNA